jgi:hypothetical protein
MKKNILDLPLPANPKSKRKEKFGKNKIKIHQTYQHSH